MIRVLQVVHSLKVGGIQSYLMNVYRNIDREKVQFDFLIFDTEEGEFEKEIKQFGGYIFRLPSRKESWIKYRIGLRQFFANHFEYKCVHVHRSNLSDIEPLTAAWKAGIPVRIIHSHSTNLPKGIVHEILHRINRIKLGIVATDYYACSVLAGEWLYRGTCAANSFKVVKNGIPVDKFVYNEEVRNIYREQLGLKQEITFANVGRLCDAKNHSFLIQIFKSLLTYFPDAKLVIVGDGELFQEIREDIRKHEIIDKVIMLGARMDVAQILQAVDCIIMPSKWEGFPVSLIEEQAAGLPCYVSDSVTDQARINENVEYISLNRTAEEWAKEIKNTFHNFCRYSDGESIKKAGYDVADTVNDLTDKYLSAYDGLKP